MIISIVIFFILVLIGLFRFTVLGGSVAGTLLTYAILILIPPMNVHLAVIGLTTVLDVVSTTLTVFANYLEKLANGPLSTATVSVFGFLRGLFMPK